MSALGFYLCLPLLYLISLLPFSVLYLVSDLFFFLLYYVIGYRKKVVYANLKNSFPEKDHQELKQIERRFYRYLCDLFLETLKILTISPRSLKKHCYLSKETLAMFDQFNDEKKSCIAVMGHFGNWEWAAVAFPLVAKQQLRGIYHPLSNVHFDKLMYKMRNRFGTKWYTMKDTPREMLKNRDEVNVTTFIADQTPPPESAYWTTFLNQDTPVFWGTEKLARKMNYPVVYISVNRMKRGSYEIRAEMLVKEPKLTAEGEISELHTKRLEKDIIRQPETWLWSHRRWKHKRPSTVQ